MDYPITFKFEENRFDEIRDKLEKLKKGDIFLAYADNSESAVFCFPPLLGLLSAKPELRNSENGYLPQLVAYNKAIAVVNPNFSDKAFFASTRPSTSCFNLEIHGKKRDVKMVRKFLEGQDGLTKRIKILETSPLDPPTSSFIYHTKYFFTPENISEGLNRLF